MSLEKNIERIADALETIAKQDNIGQIATVLEKLLSGTAVTAPPATKPATTRKPAATKTTPAPEPESEPEEPAAEPEADDLGLDDEPDEPEKVKTITEEEVRKALKNYRDINGTDEVMKVLKAHDATGMGSLKPEHYAAVMKIIN